MLCFLLFAHLCEALRCAVALVGMAGSNKLVSVLLIQGFALSLIVGTKWPSDIGSFIDIHAKPLQAIYKKVDGSFYCARYVSIFDAQDERTSSMACIEPTKQCSTKAADMLKACGAGSKT